MKSLDYSSVFESSSGKKVYKNFEAAVTDNGFAKDLSGGVLVGFSGGADSVMLLLCLLRYRKEHTSFNICCVHINHMIRGEEADSDEAFSKKIAKQLGVEFISKKIDIPKIARENSIGIEEAARNERYKEFNDIIRGRDDLCCIAVAHNSTDNLETVIFNMLRGAGARGASGIPPRRDNIVRPLLYSAKEDILSALMLASMPYVTDSTNGCVDYTRNYIRIMILPKLRQISTRPEDSVIKLSKNLRADDTFIRSLASDFLRENLLDGVVLRKALTELNAAVRARVIAQMARDAGSSCEYTHVEKICGLLEGSQDFSISLPGGVSFVSHEGKAYVGEPPYDKVKPYSIKLKLGVNTIDGISGCIILSDAPITNSYTNVYRISIQQAIPCDIINGDISVRSKIDGDSYSYGGMTHKLKKLFNDKGVPPSLRPLVPLFTDDSGILWVPGFAVRESKVSSESSERLYVALAYDVETTDYEDTFRFYKATEWS